MPAGAAGAADSPTYSFPSPAHRFKLVNGILVPGGSQVLRPGHGFYDVTAKIFELTLKANDQGDFFPVSCPARGVIQGEEGLPDEHVFARVDPEMRSMPCWRYGQSPPCVTLHLA